MLTKRIFLASILFSFMGNLFAAKDEQNNILLDEVIIKNLPKEQKSENNPSSNVYCLNIKDIEMNQINSLKDISIYVPNLYIPDYGSKITSSIYVRGIGSRMNEPAIGLYVDNIPYINKSSFDFNFFDLLQIEFLQGPQGTLYGRNTIGGLVNIYTLSPLDYQGTKLLVSYGKYNETLIKLSHYAKLSKNTGVSLAGYINHNDGYFTNSFNNEKNNSDEAGARAKLNWNINEKWNTNLSLSYDYNKQNAYPYAIYDKSTQKSGEINYNDESSYLRHLLTGGLCIQRKTDKCLFTSATGYQFLNDQMNMDQDFTTDSIFSLNQKQNQNSVTQEFTLRSNNKTQWEWVNGLFGFFNHNNIDAPMTFGSEGIDMLQSFLDSAKSQNPSMPKITILNSEMPVSGIFKMENFGVALYHQSTYSFSEKFAVTAGIRMDYERTGIDYESEAILHTSVKLPSPFIPAFPFDSTYSAKGYDANDFWEFLPKLSAKYKINDKYNVYSTIAKGYKAGGYNYAMFSDILQSQMEGTETKSVKDVIYYKPESSWNFEIGSHTEPIKNRLFCNMTLFYIYNQNQQINTTTSNGSRMITNAEKVESYGTELNIKANIAKNLSVTGTYGYTHASFLKYEANNVDYKNKIIPFAPNNTFSIGAEYGLPIKTEWLHKIIISSQYIGVGNIYWNEENTQNQSFYGLLNGEISFLIRSINVNLWIKNALDEKYNTFYFESLGNSFVQKGKPLSLGISLKYSF